MGWREWGVMGHFQRAVLGVCEGLGYGWHMACFFDAVAGIEEISHSDFNDGDRILLIDRLPDMTEC